MLADTALVVEYATSFKFESSESASKLTGTSKPSGEIIFGNWD